MKNRITYIEPKGCDSFGDRYNDSNGDLAGRIAVTRDGMFKTTPVHSIFESREFESLQAAQYYLLCAAIECAARIATAEAR